MNLKEKRKERNITLEALAKATKISKGDLSKIERGIDNPTYNTLKKIADALKVELLPFK